MFFSSTQIEAALSSTTPEDRKATLRQELEDVIPQLLSTPERYRHFGPFWWFVKALLRDHPLTRRSWLRGSFRDRSITTVCPELPPGAEEFHELLPWLGFRYFHAEMLEESPAEFHIIEAEPGTVRAYVPHDGDAGEQLDLFESAFREAQSRQRLIDPRQFTGGAWLIEAEKHAAAEDLLRSAAALRRAAARSTVARDRSTAWIRLGQLFQEHRHPAKAIFCYHNAWEREQECWIQGLVAEVHLEEGRPGEALVCYQAALQEMPENPEYLAGATRCEDLLRKQTAAFRFGA